MAGLTPAACGRVDTVAVVASRFSQKARVRECPSERNAGHLSARARCADKGGQKQELLEHARARRHPAGHCSAAHAALENSPIRVTTEQQRSCCFSATSAGMPWGVLDAPPS